MKKILLMLAFLSTNVMATILTEDFEDAFPAWESSWLAQNSNLQNHYGIGQGRGNNPDGLWINDGLNNGNISVINFNAVFGSSITAFSLDTTTWIKGAMFEAFDMSGNILVSTEITNYYGAYSNPGSYQNISFTTANGLSSFRIFGGSIEGNTSIDNVTATINETDAVSVPEPSSIAIIALGLIGLSLTRKRA